MSVKALLIFEVSSALLAGNYLNLVDFFVSIQFGEFVELFSTLVASKQRHFRKFGEYLIERIFSLLGTYYSYKTQPLDAAKPGQTIPLTKFSLGRLLNSYNGNQF